MVLRSDGNVLLDDGRFSSGVSTAFARTFLAAGLAASLIGTAWLSTAFDYSAISVVMVFVWLAAIGTVMTAKPAAQPIVILVVAVGLRAAMLWVTGAQSSVSPDQEYYAQLAMSLSRGTDLPYVVDGYAFYAHAPHLYAYLLSGVYFLTGQAAASPWILNLILDALTALAVMKIAVELGATHRWASVAGALFFCWPPVVTGSTFAVKEVLAVAVSAWGFLLLARAYRTGRFAFVRYGAMLGLLGMSQPAFFLMFAGLPLALVGRLKPSRLAVQIVAAASIAAIVLVPWIVRNWVMTGGFVPLTSGMGMNMYANAGGGFDFPPGMRHLTEAEWARQMIPAGAKLIASDIPAFLVHQAKGLLLGFGLQHGNVGILAGTTGRLAPSDFAPVLQLSLVLLWSGAVAASILRADRFVAAVLVLIVLYTLGVSVWFEFGERHRAYLLPLLLAYTAAAIPQMCATGGGLRARLRGRPVAA